MTAEPHVYRVVQEKSNLAMGMHYVACPLCGEDRPAPVLTSRDYYNNLPGEFTVVRCAACQFCYTNPRPFGERLSSYYPDSAGYYEQEDRPEPQELRQALASPRLQKRLRLLGYPNAQASPASTATLPWRVLKYGFPPAVRNGTLLEVGCATGAFLYQLQCLGWSCRGIELNRAAAEHARSRLQLNVAVSALEDAHLPQNSFDAIVLRMVLEHLPSPVDALADLHRALRPGGWLVFNVPNFRAPERRLFGRYAYFLQVPQHLSHFTPDSIRVLLQRTGFTLDRICLFPSSRDFWGSIENRRHDYGKRDWAGRIARAKPVQRLVYPLWRLYVKLCGEATRMMVYARS